MTPQEAKELLPIITAYAEGKEIEFFSEEEDSWKSIGDSAAFARRPSEYRIKPYVVPRHIPGFRALVDGEEWYGVEFFKEGDLPDGFRPLLKGEKLPHGVEYFSRQLNEWHVSARTGLNPYSDTAYRTKRPLRAIKKTVPLGFGDIGPSDTFRIKNSPDVEYQWQWKSGNKIGLPNGIASYSGLMVSFEIKRPGQDWQPCSKEVEA